MKLLLIDDEDDVRRIARLGLERIGKMEVTEATSADEGIRKAEQDAPDVILLDVMMPGRDGPSALEALQANPKTRDIPVIFLTAKALSSEVERLKSLGAAGILTKPFDPVKLPAEVKAVLDAKS
jgi:CheY-like chemotaxis protein